MSEKPISETDRNDLDTTEQRHAVRERYATIATDSTGCCSGSSCASDDELDTHSHQLGYSDDDLAVAEDANLGLGCGNPTALAALEEGETVIDLGSGGGFDCFLAAQEVGDSGRVIGVDMTPEMIELARSNAEKNDANVEFRLGEIEHLPVADASADVIISNCVVNLSPEPAQVFQEAYRVLRPGGRLSISDVVQTTAFPEDIRSDPEAVAACVAGASTIETLDTLLVAAGFEDRDIVPDVESGTFIREWDESRDLSDYIVSARIEARKPES
jgi:arsenite methyltransferase